MMLTGRIWKDGRDWLAECEAIGAMTQGKNRKDAAAMLADCIEVKIGPGTLSVTVTETGPLGDEEHAVLIEADRPGALAAEVLKYQRYRAGLTLADVAKRIGSTSTNAYGAYEQGKREPTVGKLRELLAVVAPDMVLTIGPRATAPKKRVAK